MLDRGALKDEHHVMRHIPAARRFVDPSGKQCGPNPTAFNIRPMDKGHLSVTEIEFYGSMSATTRGIAAAAFRESLESKKIGPKSIFAWTRVSKVKSAANQFGKIVQVIHSPVDGNPGHAEILYFTDDDFALLDHFATSVFDEYAVVEDMNVPSRFISEAKTAVSHDHVDD